MSSELPWSGPHRLRGLEQRHSTGGYSACRSVLGWPSLGGRAADVSSDALGCDDRWLTRWRRWTHILVVAGYSGTPLSKKLGIKDGSRVAIVRAPEGFENTLGKLPPGVSLRTQARGRLDVIVFFATRRRELERRFPTLARNLEPNGGFWVSWPKRASGVATDLTGDVAREIGLGAGLVDNKVCAIDEIWSGLRFVCRLADRPRYNGRR